MLGVSSYIWRDNFDYILFERRPEKPAFCICENKDADQLRGNREADAKLISAFVFAI